MFLLPVLIPGRPDVTRSPDPFIMSREFWSGKERGVLAPASVHPVILIYRRTLVPGVPSFRPVNLMRKALMMHHKGCPRNREHRLFCRRERHASQEVIPAKGSEETRVCRSSLSGSGVLFLAVDSFARLKFSPTITRSLMPLLSPATPCLLMPGTWPSSLQTIFFPLKCTLMRFSHSPGPGIGILIRESICLPLTGRPFADSHNQPYLRTCISFPSQCLFPSRLTGAHNLSLISVSGRGKSLLQRKKRGRDLKNRLHVVKKTTASKD